jgi:HKD family nuclease
MIQQGQKNLVAKIKNKTQSGITVEILGSKMLDVFQ